MPAVEEEPYQPDKENFSQDSREPLIDISLTDSTELWLIQWPYGQVPDFHGKELSLSLGHDGCLGSFEASSGKAYDMMSSAAHEPDATVFVSSASETKIVGKISRRVSLVRYPEPKELEKQEAERKSRHLHQTSGRSSLTISHSATPTRSSKARSSLSSRGHTTSAGSSKHKSSFSQVGEQSNSKRRRHSHGHTGSTDRSTIDSGRAPNVNAFSGS